MDHYDLEVVWHPCFELIVSLLAYISKPLHKVIDLGASWRSAVRQGLPDPLERQLQELKRSGDIEFAVGVAQYAARDYSQQSTAGFAGGATIEDFLIWYAQLDVGQLYSLAASHAQLGGTVPANLVDIHGQSVAMLRGWHEHYFSSIDPAILTGLAKEAEVRRLRLLEVPPDAAIEEASGGALVTPSPAIERLALIPQHHACPWNVYSMVGRVVLQFYPADVLPVEPGEPPRRLIRLARALDDPNRLRMLHYLAGGPRLFGEIAAQVPLTKPTVHYHLVLLRAAGLVRVETDLTRPFTDKYALRQAALAELAAELDGYLRLDGNSRKD